MILARRNRNLLQTVFAQGGSRNQPLGFIARRGRIARTMPSQDIRPSVTRRYSVNNAEHKLSLKNYS